MLRSEFFPTTVVDPAYTNALSVDFSMLHRAVALAQPDAYEQPGPLTISFVDSTDRGRSNLGGYAPGHATVFMPSVLKTYGTPQELDDGLSRVVLHEVGHHLDP